MSLLSVLRHSGGFNFKAMLCEVPGETGGGAVEKGRVEQ